MPDPGRVSDAADALGAWQQQPEYSLPDEAGAASKRHLVKLYRPPRSDVPGLAVAATVLTAFITLWGHAMFQVKLTGLQRSPWWDIAGTWLGLEFLYTGLFITTHDSMHGTICMRNRRLNDAIGRLCISLYAWFDYDALHAKHWLHHNHTGVVGKDPDFHAGDMRMVPWLLNFMGGYVTGWQVARITTWVCSLNLVLGVPWANIVTYQATAAWASALRLFYFGTFLPHLPASPSQAMPWWRSHTTALPDALAFLQCWCFGLHFEHHRWPYAPWWHLPKLRAIVARDAAATAKAAALAGGAHVRASPAT